MRAFCTGLLRNVNGGCKSNIGRDQERQKAAATVSIFDAYNVEADWQTNTSASETFICSSTRGGG